MFDSIFSNADSLSLNLSTKEMAMAMLASLVLGLVISLVYIFTNKGKKMSTNFAVSLVMLPVLVCVVIMLVGSDIARAFSIAGVFTMVRFRSVPGDSKDITQVLFAMSVGLATGLGYIGFATIITVVVCATIIILKFSNYAVSKNPAKTLRITIPETLNYQGAFDDLFKEYALHTSMERVRTTNMGSMYELTYSISFKANVDEKKFIDELRCRNGNLNIILAKSETVEML